MTTKTLLATGFSGFPGMPVNPTERLMGRLPKRLPAHIHGVRFCYAVLPPEWRAREERTQHIIKKVDPVAVVHFGVDGSQRSINIETLARNWASTTRADAAGDVAPHRLLAKAGTPNRRATLPVRSLQKSARRSGVDVRLSNNAGDYLCNATLWDTLGTGRQAVFVHVPSLPRGRYENRPSYHSVETAAVYLLSDLALKLS
ncbi:peptidase C15, pyroglutamyl peptidase I [Roseibium sp. TrichSKD4]|uniref:pyroglutamyl-peptidase I family protein n=1 Tax=Roseibium sp. TrichSKD4 TaxID=744980 RepID=UPI0001E571B8|nr:peptidase C15, pyroglutamyl peptidase I [Roseibium sp. TrichSKD4]EFO28993.1 peptidase C15, pyroglutamyl peptidase I [Roseibium sp. TrichSKD4]